MIRPILRLAPGLFIAIAAAAPASASPWTLRTIGGDRRDSVAAVAALPGGGLIIAGSFEGTLRLGEDRLESAGASDAFIARLAATGEVEWAARLGGEGFDTATAVLVDRMGNPVLVGDVSGWARAGGRRLRARGPSDGFAISFRPDGTVRWAVTFGGPDFDATTAAALTSQGDLAVTGSTGTEPDDDRAQTADVDILVALVSPDGRLRWMRTFGGPEWDGGLAVAPDRKGGVAVAGAFAGELSLADQTLRAAGPSDGFLLRLTSRGAIAQADRFGGEGNDAVTAVTIAPDGGVALAGRFTGTILVGKELLTSAGESDAFIARFAADGQPSWAIRTGGVGEEEVRALCELPGGALLVAATYAPGLERAGEGRGPSDVVLHLVAGAGALYEVALLSGPFASARGMAVMDDGTVAIAGWFAGHLRIGSQPIAGAGGLDGFLVTTWLDVWGD